VLPLGDINQLLTFGGEWRHDKLKDPVNLTGGSSSSTSTASTRCSKTNGVSSNRWR
jgi:outer membrane receptor for ferrienterochelin and colicins